MEMVGSCSCSVLSALQEAGMRLPNGPAAEQGGDAGKGEPFPKTLAGSPKTAHPVLPSQLVFDLIKPKELRQHQKYWKVLLQS